MKCHWMVRGSMSAFSAALRVVLAKVQLAGRRLVEGQDVIGRLSFDTATSLT